LKSFPTISSPFSALPGIRRSAFQQLLLGRIKFSPSRAFATLKSVGAPVPRAGIERIPRPPADRSGKSGRNGYFFAKATPPPPPPKDTWFARDADLTSR
jgi:hypothetical protein